MPDLRTHVHLHNRHFIVARAPDGTVLRIRERKTRNPGHPCLERLEDVPYWHYRHHPAVGPGSIASQVIAEATR